MTTLYFLIYNESPLRIGIYGADDALIAARFAPVAPHGEISTLAKHIRVALRRVRRARATGHILAGPFGY